VKYKFKLNINNDGIINNNEPYINISVLEEPFNESAEAIDNTIDTINQLLYSVNKESFKINKWEFPTVKLTFVAGDSYNQPLVSV